MPNKPKLSVGQSAVIMLLGDVMMAMALLTDEARRDLGDVIESNKILSLTKDREICEEVNKFIDSLVSFLKHTNCKLETKKASDAKEEEELGKVKITDVHTEHCCKEHKRCKYGESDCTVVMGILKPSFPCNCEHM